MTEIATNRSARLEARITPEVQDRLRRAASRRGRTLSEFVVEAALAEADRVEEREMMRMSRDEAIQIARLLLDPPEPGPALRRAVKRHRRLIDSSEP